MQWGFLLSPDTFLVESVKVLKRQQGSGEEAEVDRKVTAQGFTTDDTIGTITSKVPKTIRFIYTFFLFGQTKTHTDIQK